MTATFITVTKNSVTGWDVVQKSFPVYTDSKTTLKIVSKELGLHSEDQKAAEVAAKDFAANNSVLYVPEGGSVITVSPFYKSHMPVELRCDGGVMQCGVPDDNFDSVKRVALRLAKIKNMPFVMLL
jgi:hypothetical protein